MGRSASTSEMRAPVAHRARSSRRSRSQLAAAMTARTSSGDRPSGGCHRLLVADRTECVCRVESDSSRGPRSASDRPGEFGPGLGMAAYRTQGSYCSIGARRLPAVEARAFVRTSDLWCYPDAVTSDPGCPGAGEHFNVGAGLPVSAQRGRQGQRGSLYAGLVGLGCRGVLGASASN